MSISYPTHVELDHPVAGKMKVTGNQIKFTNKKVKIDRPAPLLGQHNEEILHEKLGYTPEQVAQLKEEGVLLVPGNRFELPGGARLGYCAPEPVLREGLARLGRALRQFD